MHADAFFSIGKTHEVCQDFAKAGCLAPGHTFALLSDGCSSSPDTDFGARFMVMATLHYRNIYGVEKTPFEYSIFDPSWVVWRASEMVRPPLSSRCLDATLLGIFERPEGVSVAVAGDGVVIARRRDGKVEVYDYDFRGAPGYPSYLRDPSRLEAYYKEGYGDRLISFYEDIGAEVVAEPQPGKYRFTPGAQLQAEHDGPCSFLHFFREDYDLVLVASDGVHSFQNANTMGTVPMLEVIPHLVDIKSYTGQFMTRRCRAFQKFCAKEGWHHNDDLSVAAVYMGEEG